MLTKELEEPKAVDVDQKRVRFSEAHWYDPEGKINVFVGGVGSIGSYLCYLLARQNINIYAYDHDLVEEQNLGGQLYSDKDFGSSKIDALAKNIESLCEDAKCYFAQLKVDLDNEELREALYSDIQPYVFSCFDNMLARKHLFTAWVDKFKDVEDAIFIDGRMLAEQGQVFVVTKDRIGEYEKYLYSDDEVAEAPCTFKYTTFCATMISSLMISSFNNYIGNKKVPVREVPFKIEYNLQLLKFDVHEYKSTT